MRRVRIKTWAEMAVGAKELSNSIAVKDEVYFTLYMEQHLPEDRIIELNDDGDWELKDNITFTITERMIKEVIEPVNAKEELSTSPTPMRSDAREGDRMWSVLTGWGTISIREVGGDPIIHIPDNDELNTTSYNQHKAYFIEGEQALFFTPPTITKKMLEVPETVVEKVILTKKDIADKFGISLSAMEIEE